MNKLRYLLAFLLMLSAQYMMIVFSSSTYMFVDYANSSVDENGKTSISYLYGVSDSIAHHFQGTLNLPAPVGTWSLIAMSMAFILLSCHQIIKIYTNDRVNFFRACHISFVTYFICLAVNIFLIYPSTIGAQRNALSLALPNLSEKSQDRLLEAVNIGIIFEGFVITVFVGFIILFLTIASYEMLYKIWQPIKKTIERNLITDAYRKLRPSDPFVEFISGDMVEIVQYIASVSWHILPVITQERVVLKRVGINDFWQSTLTTDLDKITEKIKTDLTRTRELLSDKACNMDKRIHTSMLERFKASRLNKAIKKRQATLDIIESEAKKVSDKMLRQVMRKYKDEVAESGAASIEQALEALKNGLKNGLGDAFLGESWTLKELSERNLNIMPPNTKFYFRHGFRELIVIDQPPDVRTIFVGQEGTGNVRRLSFPHVVFIMLFERGEVDECYLFYANKPISGFDDLLLRPNLPHINDEYEICLNFDGHEAKTLEGKVSEVLNHFWRTGFRLDHDKNHFAYYARKYKSLASLNAWANSTKENPGFIMGIPWNPAYQLGDFIHRLISGWSKDFNDIGQAITSKIEKAFEENLVEFRLLLKKAVSGADTDATSKAAAEQFIVESLRGIHESWESAIRESTGEFSEKDLPIKALLESIEKSIDAAIADSAQILADSVISARIREAETVTQELLKEGVE